MPLVKIIQSCQANSPHKGSILRKTFPNYDIVICVSSLQSPFLGKVLIWFSHLPDLQATFSPHPNMSQIVGWLSPLGFGRGGGPGRSDGDFVDRLNHTYTVVVLIVFAVIVSTKQYVGDPIQCWTPAYFSTSYIDYANKVCWVSNTYYNPFDQDVPDDTTLKQHIVYYQWVPMILLLQAFFFYLPYTGWSLLGKRSGIDVNSLVDAARNMHESDSNEKTLKYIVKQLDRFCGAMRPRRIGRCAAFRRAIAERCFFICGMKHGTYMLTLYMITKILFVVNSIAQFFMMNLFLGSGYAMYGIHVLQSLATGNEWKASRHFPRVTLCDFKVRQLGNIHDYTVQCVLPINLFNEKIFIFVWFWFVLVACLSIINCIIWLARTLFRIDHVKFVKRYLKLLNKLDSGSDKKMLRRFVRDYLRPDGILTLRIMSINTNELVVAEIIAELWEFFKDNPPNWNKGHEDNDDGGSDV